MFTLSFSFVKYVKIILIWKLKKKKKKKISKTDFLSTLAETLPDYDSIFSDYKNISKEKFRNLLRDFQSSNKAVL